MNLQCNIENDAEELQQESQESWDKFYKHNQDKFFKNRNYLSFAFDIIDKAIEDRKQRTGEIGEGEEMKEPEVTLFEVGCGTGSTLIPLKEKYQDKLSLYACDFSPNAVKLLQDQQICTKAFVADLVSPDPLSAFISDFSLDFSTLIFFLSAIHPSLHLQVLQRLTEKLKPTGHLLFRDYGVYDLAMLRFIKKGKGVVDPTESGGWVFRRGDNTLACFFTIAQLKELMEKCGLEEVRSEYCTVERGNVKRGITMRRVFINAIYRKV